MNYIPGFPQLFFVLAYFEEYIFCCRHLAVRLWLYCGYLLALGEQDLKVDY